VLEGNRVIGVTGVLSDITERKQAEDMLKESEARYAAVVENSRDGIAVLQDGVVRFANRMSLELVGYAPAELIGVDFLAMVSPGERELVSQRYLDRMAGKKVPNIYEIVLVTKQGLELPVELNATIIDYEGKPADLVFIRDISERKQMVRKLERSERNLQMAQAVAHVGHWRLDPRTETVEASDELLRIFGLTSEVASLEAFAQVVHPDDREYYLHHIRKGMKPGEPWDIEHRLVCDDGTEKTVRVIGNPIVVETGRVAAVVGTVQDITERKTAEERLRQSEETLRAYLERAPDGVYMADTESVFLYGNREAERITGYKREELIGRSFLEIGLLPDEYLEPAASMLADNLEGKPVGPRELQLIRKDGSPIWIEINASPVVDGEGMTIIGFARDITERKTAEEQLRSEKEKAQRYLDVAGTMIVVLDRDGMITLANRRTQEILGCEEEEILGKDWYANFVPEHADRKTRLRMISDELEVPERTENAVLTKAGDERTVHWQNVPLRDDEGNLIGILSSGDDVTDLRRAESEAEAHRERLQETMDNVLDGIVTSDSHGIVTQANGSLARIGGYDSPDELIGRPFMDLVAEDDLLTVAEAYGLALQKRVTRLEEMELAALRKDGSEVPVTVSVANSYRDDGSLISSFAVVRDITERKRLVEQLRHSQLMALLGEMTAGIAHEVNNPLASSLLFSELLLEGDLQDDTRKYAAAVHDEVKRAGEIMSDLLTYSRQSNPDSARIDLRPIVRKVVDMREYTQGVRDIKTVARFTNHPLLVDGDASQLTQVLMNLIVNAEDAVERAEERKITVSTRVVGDRAVFSVADTGRGILEENLVKIFNPFFTTKRGAKGTGLGLSVCYGIVTGHGGTIRGENNGNGGATFTVELPLAVSAPEMSPQEVAS
jgi:PAS domain S-box-containing protein